MPVALILIGLLLIIAGLRGKVDLLGDVLKDDFTGRPNFVAWVVMIVAITLLGNYRPARSLSNGLYALIIISALIGNRGFFGQLERAIK